jgi:hypothetical protein
MRRGHSASVNAQVLKAKLSDIFEGVGALARVEPSEPDEAEVLEAYRALSEEKKRVVRELLKVLDPETVPAKTCLLPPNLLDELRSELVALVASVPKILVVGRVPNNGLRSVPKHDTNSVAFHRLNSRKEVAVSGDQHRARDLSSGGKFDHVHAEHDVHTFLLEDGVPSIIHTALCQSAKTYLEARKAIQCREEARLCSVPSALIGRRRVALIRRAVVVVSSKEPKPLRKLPGQRAEIHLRAGELVLKELVEVGPIDKNGGLIHRMCSPKNKAGVHENAGEDKMLTSVKTTAMMTASVYTRPCQTSRLR